MVMIMILSGTLVPAKMDKKLQTAFFFPHLDVYVNIRLETFKLHTYRWFHWLFLAHGHFIKPKTIVPHLECNYQPQ